MAMALLWLVSRLTAIAVARGRRARIAVRSLARERAMADESIDSLSSQLQETKSLLAGARHDVEERDSQIVLLKAEIESLALWRARELERLRTEAAIIVQRRGRPAQPEADEEF